LPLYSETALRRVRDLKLKVSAQEEHVRYLSYIEEYIVNQRSKYGLGATYYEPRVHTEKDDWAMKDMNMLPYRFRGLREYLGYLES
jgi:hypothetical protein